MRLRNGSEHSGGDRHADRFLALYENAGRDLLAYLLRRAANAEDAADLFAESFTVVWEKRTQIPLELTDARPWVFGIARNVLFRGYDRQRRSQRLSDALAAELRTAGLAAADAEVMDTAMDDRVRLALAELSPLDREIVTLGAWDGLQPREIAVILGLSANVVRVRAHRARTTLRTLLAAEATAPESAG